MRRNTPEQAAAAKIRQREAIRAWNAENAERVRAVAKAYRESHKAERAARAKAWAAANPEKVREKSRRWVERNPEAAKAKTAEWRKRNPEWDRAKQARRRAAGDLKVDVLKAVDVCSDGLCAYCLKQCRVTVDHVVPISRGGDNELTNLVAACGSCNSSKRARTPLEFIFKLPKLGVQPW